MSQINAKVRSRRRRVGRYDRLGLAIAVVAVAGVIALSAVAGVIATKRRTDDQQASREAAASLRTGAILFVAPEGHACRQKLIDNTTWIISDNGAVNCDSAVSNITLTQRRQWSAERVEAIRAGLAGR